MLKFISGLVVGLLITGGAATAGQRFQQWEYAQTRFGYLDSRATIFNYIGAMGKQGWEMTGVDRKTGTSDDWLMFYFKRVKN